VASAPLEESGAARMGFSTGREILCQHHKKAGFHEEAGFWESIRRRLLEGRFDQAEMAVLTAVEDVHLLALGIEEDEELLARHLHL